jgi:predicted transcriptional regulator
MSGSLPESCSMVIQQTSLFAYREAKEHLGEKQRRVYDLLSEHYGPMCNQEIANHLHWPINCVTPRVKELRDMGYVKENGKSYGPSGRLVIFWETV